MAWLAKGNWPELQHLKLSFNPFLDASAIAHLSATNWPLQTLELSFMPVTAAMAAELAGLWLPNLLLLSLINTGLTAAAVSEFARADWPELMHLNISTNGLHIRDISHISTGLWPKCQVRGHVMIAFVLAQNIVLTRLWCLNAGPFSCLQASQPHMLWHQQICCLN